VSKPGFSLYGIVGIVVFGLAVILMRQGREPFASYFYCFAWWSYIMVADACVYRARGASLLSSYPGRFATMIPLSVFTWSLFEACNFRLDNWQYVNVPEETWKRWLGYAVAYGTVLPGLCVTTHLVQVAGLWKGVRSKQFSLSARGRSVVMSVGIACLVSTIVVPRYTFPLVWLAGILVLDPVNYRGGMPSVGRDLESGDLERTLNIMTAGMICGFLWEFWNFWAEVKWIYTVPFFDWGKVFEMPVAGYLGFPPFAVSAFLIYHGLVRCVERTSRFSRIVLWVVVAVMCGVVFYGIDRFTAVFGVPLSADGWRMERSVFIGVRGQGIGEVSETVPWNSLSSVSLRVQSHGGVGRAR